MQKGLAQPLVILGLLLVLFGGIYFINLPSNNSQVSPKADTELVKYTNGDLGVEFKAAKELVVKQDSEEDFNKRGNGDFRKNFKSYITYEPGKFLKALVVLDKDQNYDTNPFTVWVFDNPDDLTIDDWYKEYWYYPFVWGDFTSRSEIVAPVNEATISGQVAKSGIVDYQPGKPKFVYLSHDNKMYLFKVIGNDGEKILSSFKLLQ